ncbi:MAG: hypothetical protein Q7S02_00360, partial [bacterium]|nr:hypothetical protein [bacterium]
MRMRNAIVATLALGVGIDLLSFIAWSTPALETLLAVTVLACAAVSAMVDIKWGIAAVLLELLWGSHGHLLHVSVGGVDWSLRMGLFSIVIAATVWHLRSSAARQWVIRTLRAHPVFWPMIVFLVTVAFATALGAWRHAWDSVFLDANAWGFLLLMPAFLLACREEVQRQWLVKVLLVGALYLVCRTYVLFFLFTHNLGGLWVPLYQWVRDTRLGEITVFPGGFPRIFLPSMVYLLLAIPVAWQSRTSAVLRWSVLGGGVAVLVLSLSRSYWIGLVSLVAAVA